MFTLLEGGRPRTASSKPHLVGHQRQHLRGKAVEQLLAAVRLGQRLSLEELGSQQVLAAVCLACTCRAGKPRHAQNSNSLHHSSTQHSQHSTAPSAPSAHLVERALHAGCHLLRGTASLQIGACRSHQLI